MGMETLAIAGIVSAVAAATGVTVSAVQGEKSREAAENARRSQEAAQAKALAEQEKSTNQAEYQRLKALETDSESTKYASAWGVDSAIAAKTSKKAKDASDMINSGTKQEEENPFYTKGII